MIGTELVHKRLELIKELYPRIQRVIGICSGPGSLGAPIVVSWIRECEVAAGKLRLPFEYVEVSSDPSHWDGTYASFAAVPGTALSPIESPYLLQHRALLAELSLKHRLPAVYALQDHVRAGGLCSYGVNLNYAFERPAFYIAKILDGAKPSELPVEQPTTYELLINLKTARALGLSMPQSLRLRADELIE